MTGIYLPSRSLGLPRDDGNMFYLLDSSTVPALSLSNGLGMTGICLTFLIPRLPASAGAPPHFAHPPPRLRKWHSKATTGRRDDNEDAFTFAIFGRQARDDKGRLFCSHYFSRRNLGNNKRRNNTAQDRNQHCRQKPI